MVEPVHGRKTLLRGFGRPVANLEERGIDFPTVGKIGGQGREQSGETVPQEPIAFQNSAYLEFRARISYSCYHGRSGVGASWVEGAGGAAAVERAAAATPQPWWHPVIEPRAL